MKNEGRVFWLDNLKALGIMLVVFGHAPAVNGHIANIIYSFHMPLFFFASGCTHKGGHFRKQISSIISNLFVPYVFFLIISCIYWMFANKYSPMKIYPNDVLAAFAYGSSINNNFYFNPPLWFFSALISLKITAVSVSYIFKSRSLPISLIISIASVYYFNNSEIRLPQGFDIALTSLFFYFFGEWVYKNNEKLNSNMWRNSIYSILALSMVYILSLRNGRVDVNTLQFSNELIFMVNALMGIIMVYYLSQIIGKSDKLNFISNNTIWYFPLHGFVFSFFTLFIVKILEADKSIKDDSMIFSVIYSIGAFVVLSACVKIKNKIGFKYF